MNFLDESLLTVYPLLFYVDLLIFIILISVCLFVLLELMLSEDLSEYHIIRLIACYSFLFSIGYLIGRFFLY